jgi:hypothetical protein
VPLPDPAAVAESGADCKAEADFDVEGLGKGLPVGEASAAVGVAAGLGEAKEGDPVAEAAGDAESTGDAVPGEDGGAPEVAEALGERGAEAEGGELPLFSSVRAQERVASVEPE